MLSRIAVVTSCAAMLAGCTGTTGPAVPAGPAGAGTTSMGVRSIQARWWEWAAAEPPATNPVADRTGVHCARNQPDDVWFLAGTFGGVARRTCTVPLGVPLVAPAINTTAGDEDGCRDFLAAVTGTIEVDGAEVPLDRIEPETISFVARPGNPVTELPGRTESEACGLWARIAPPTAGEHTVRIRARRGTFAVDAAYTLTVTAASSPAVQAQAAGGGVRFRDEF